MTGIVSKFLTNQLKTSNLCRHVSGSENIMHHFSVAPLRHTIEEAMVNDLRVDFNFFYFKFMA